LHDLTLPYQDLSRELVPLTTTLPITLLNLSRISGIFSAFYSSLKEGTDNADSGLDSALHLHRALYETCLSEAVSELPETTKQLLRVGALRALEPKLVERTYSTLSQILRITAPSLLKPESKDILQQAWSEVRPYLRPKQNKRVIRKCVADAWVGVIRKARGDGLARLLDVLLEGEYEGMEAVWAESMKGTGNSFHSRAVAIFGILLDRLAASPSEAQMATLSSVVTALVHHGSSTTLAPIVETITARIDSSSDTTIASTPPSSMLTLLSITLLVRKGKRFPESLLKPTMAKLLSLASSIDVNNKQPGTVDSTWRRALVQAVVGTLLAGKLVNWLSPGVSLIETLWNGLVSL
jgi:U3 small nucleolar RNA-associated protein 20